MRVLKYNVVKTKRVTFLEHKGHKFRVLYHQVGSTSPHYFECRFKTDLLTKDGWVLLADDDDIGFERVFCPQEAEHEQDAANFLAEMQAFIETLYD